MGMSHHEPCLRQGEEYKYLRGPKSIYGDAWNFLKNEKGITRFWEDGLERSGKFENVITVEKKHQKLFAELYEQMKSGTLYKKKEPVLWKCPSCGFEGTMKEAWQKCPLCQAEQGVIRPILPEDANL